MFTVLHVETSKFFIKVYRSIIEEKKARYLQADNPDQAMQILEENPETVNIIISASSIDGGMAAFVKRLG